MLSSDVTTPICGGQWCHTNNAVMSQSETSDVTRESFTKLKSIKLENIFEIWESYYKNEIIAAKLL